MDSENLWGKTIEVEGTYRNMFGFNDNQRITYYLTSNLLESKAKAMNTSTTIQKSIRDVQKNFIKVKELRYENKFKSESNELPTDLDVLTNYIYDKLDKKEHIFNVLYFVRDSYYIRLEENEECNVNQETKLKIPTLELVINALNEMNNNRLGYYNEVKKENKNCMQLINENDEQPFNFERLLIDQKSNKSCFIKEYRETLQRYYNDKWEIIHNKINDKVDTKIKAKKQELSVNEKQELSDNELDLLYQDYYLKYLSKLYIKHNNYFDNKSIYKYEIQRNSVYNIIDYFCRFSDHVLQNYSKRKKLLNSIDRIDIVYMRCKELYNQFVNYRDKYYFNENTEEQKNIDNIFKNFEK